jgi:hypothetical protein
MYRTLMCCLCACVTLSQLYHHKSLLKEVTHRRAAAHAAQLRLAQAELNQRGWLGEQRRLAFEVELRFRAERQLLARVQEITRIVDVKQQREYAARSLAQRNAHSARDDLRQHTVWHSVAPDGSCPAEVPHWEWRLLLQAAEAVDPVLQYEALLQLGAQSRLTQSELLRLTGHYRTILRNPEFDGILDTAHPPCSSEAFAKMTGERILHMTCDDNPRYAVDDGVELLPYDGPVRLSGGETVVAYCGGEINVVSHPLRQPEIITRALSVKPILSRCCYPLGSSVCAAHPYRSMLLDRCMCPSLWPTQLGGNLLAGGRTFSSSWWTPPPGRTFAAHFRRL